MKLIVDKQKNGLTNTEFTKYLKNRVEKSELNQLEVELVNSRVIGRQSVKLGIIGLSFDGSLQMDKFGQYYTEVLATSYQFVLFVCFENASQLPII